MVVRLLGAPEIESGGAIVDGPRGRKVWALIAYLVLAEQRVPRSRLAALMFEGADDPLGALRWALSQVRRTLGLAGVLRGDPLKLELPSSVQVDLLSLLDGSADPGLVRGELLEGTDPDAGEAFNAWLLVERRRLAGVCEGVLRNAALATLAAGVPLEGAGLASRALSLNPFDACTSSWCAASRELDSLELRVTRRALARFCFAGSLDGHRIRGCVARPRRTNPRGCRRVVTGPQRSGS
jgi:hypothetical protein